jgi:hypothetical protein
MRKGRRNFVVIVGALSALIVVMVIGSGRRNRRPEGAVATEATEDAPARSAADRSERRWPRPGQATPPVPSTPAPANVEAPTAADGSAALASAGPADAGAELEGPREMLDGVRTSGPAKGRWTRNASDLLEQVRRSLPDGLQDQIRFGAVACYDKACLAPVAFRDMKTFEDTAPSFYKLLEGWPGAQGRTSAVATDGGVVEVTWMMANPERGAF